jgi:hypothetical protein
MGLGVEGQGTVAGFLLFLPLSLGLCQLWKVIPFMTGEIRMGPPDFVLMMTTRPWLDLGRFRLKNRSLGLNYDNSAICPASSDGYLSFRPNRQWHNDSYTVLLEFFAFYPSSLMKSWCRRFISTLHKLAPWLEVSSEILVPLFLAVDTDVLSCFTDHGSFRLVQSRHGHPILDFLDEGYFLLWFHGDALPVLYKYFRQTEFSSIWLNRYHRPPTCPFRSTWLGYYSATWALVVTLPFRLRISDFLGFFCEV